MRDERSEMGDDQKVFQRRTINAIRGEITRETPSNKREGTQKHIDFPPPVGIRTKQSFPAKTTIVMEVMISKWAPIDIGEREKRNLRVD